MATNLRLMMAMVLLLAACGRSQQSTTAKKNAANPCGKNTTQTGLNECSAKLFHRADSRLDALYRKITESLQKELDAAQTKNSTDEIKHFETSLKMLSDAEQAWVAYRDLQCKAAMQQEEGGSMAPMVNTECMQQLIEHRIEELRHSYQLVN